MDVSPTRVTDPALVERVVEQCKGSGQDSILYDMLMILKATIRGESKARNRKPEDFAPDMQRRIELFSSYGQLYCVVVHTATPSSPWFKVTVTGMDVYELNSGSELLEIAMRFPTHTIGLGRIPR